MARRNRLAILLTLLLVVPFAACGTAEEPAEAPAQETPEPAAPETPTVPEPEEPAEEVPSPQQPELVGEIRLGGEDLIWDPNPTDVAPYDWTVRVTNDTTATLDITVRFQLLDDNDAVIKTERATVRLQPAQSRTIRETSSIAYAQANRVYSYAASYDWAIVEG